MKVMCINGASREDVTVLGNALTESQRVFEGDVYTVVDRNTVFGFDSYLLLEKPGNLWYMASRFIPLSDIDKTEMVRNLQTETA